MKPRARANGPPRRRAPREPFDRNGERAESFAAGTRFAKETLWHVRVAFAAPVEGPLLLGDGCYLGRALEGMDVLRAGKAGRLTLASAVLDAESDPLFAAARVWESVTEYDVTRHRRRLGDEDALKADVAAELERCGWPRLPPDAIEVLAVRRGPRSGLLGRLRLVSPTAQTGPLLIGRTAHKGGGLFAGS